MNPKEVLQFFVQHPWTQTFHNDYASWIGWGALVVAILVCTFGPLWLIRSLVMAHYQAKLLKQKTKRWLALTDDFPDDSGTKGADGWLAVPPDFHNK